MKKKIAWLILPIAACAAGVIAACAAEPPVEELDPPVLTLSVEDESVRLAWDTVKNVTYEVYRAESKFSSYRLIGEGEGSFEAEKDLGAYYRVAAKNSLGETLAVSDSVGMETELFGANTYVYAPSDDAGSVSRELSALFGKMERAHFSDERYSVLFKPGDYGSVSVSVPFFTTVAGLGKTPDEVTLSSLRCDAAWNTNSLINFWRGAENMSFSQDCMWAVSQGVFLRNVKFGGDLSLFDYGQSNPMASGGFLANAVVEGRVSSGSQQQWFTRNAKIGGWSGSVWNMVFSGVENAPATTDYAKGGNKYTSLDATPLVREKPYLIFNDGSYAIAVPALKRDSSGYADASVGARIISFENIYFAHPTRDTAESISAQIEADKDIVFTPGVYRLESPIAVNRSGAVLLGMGMATLLSDAGKGCMTVGDADGVSVAGLLFDAGTHETDCLLEVGKTGARHTADPIFLFDCFFRVGGAINANTYAETSLRIRAGDTVTDNIWLWRADHTNGVGWDKNNGSYGLVVYGDGVKCYGLFAEHYKKYNVSWHGDGGLVVFYQSELAYDVPSNALWIADDGGRGCASFRVHDEVNTFNAYGLGIYTNFQNSGIELECLMKTPQKSGISIRNLYGYAMSTRGKVLHLINGTGQGLDSENRNGALGEYRGA